MKNQAIKKQPALFDLGGRIIDDIRIKKHERLIRGMIVKFFPANACFEASMSQYDLRNQCRLEAVMSLLNFDPHLALTGITKNESRKTRSDEEHLKWKRENPELALEKAESEWVGKRLANYLRRLRWKNSIEEKGGRAASLNAMFAKTNTQLNLDGSAKSLFGPDSDRPDSEEVLFGVQDQHEAVLNLDWDRCQENLDQLGAIHDKQGLEAFNNAFRALPQDEQEDLIAFCSMRSAAERRIYAAPNYEEAEAEAQASEEKKRSDASDSDEESIE